MKWFMGPWFYKYLLHICYCFTFQKLLQKFHLFAYSVSSALLAWNMYSLKYASENSTYFIEATKYMQVNVSVQSYSYTYAKLKVLIN